MPLPRNTNFSVRNLNCWWRNLTPLRSLGKSAHGSPLWRWGSMVGIGPLCWWTVDFGGDANYLQVAARVSRTLLRKVRNCWMLWVLLVRMLVSSILTVLRLTILLLWTSVTLKVLDPKTIQAGLEKSLVLYVSLCLSTDTLRTMSQQMMNCSNSFECWENKQVSRKE